ncbi:hypothetical protein H9P43_004650 [Blastocladiella emersonii ATCC 22665]|nr:hypothetical protein H9P43_004650 [Blastocladiella emersonii ATCC 22665]
MDPPVLQPATPSNRPAPAQQQPQLQQQQQPLPSYDVLPNGAFDSLGIHICKRSDGPGAAAPGVLPLVPYLLEPGDAVEALAFAAGANDPEAFATRLLDAAGRDPALAVLGMVRATVNRFYTRPAADRAPIHRAYTQWLATPAALTALLARDPALANLFRTNYPVAADVRAALDRLTQVGVAAFDPTAPIASAPTAANPLGPLPLTQTETWLVVLSRALYAQYPPHIHRNLPLLLLAAVADGDLDPTTWLYQAVATACAARTGRRLQYPGAYGTYFSEAELAMASRMRDQLGPAPLKFLADYLEVPSSDTLEQYYREHARRHGTHEHRAVHVDWTPPQGEQQQQQQQQQQPQQLPPQREFRSIRVPWTPPHARTP